MPELAGYHLELADSQTTLLSAEHYAVAAVMRKEDVIQTDHAESACSMT
jgi:hypothetical protein